MAEERALTLEALRVMDAIDRRGSFAAAADELGRVPSALSRWDRICPIALVVRTGKAQEMRIFSGRGASAASKTGRMYLTKRESHSSRVLKVGG